MVKLAVLALALFQAEKPERTPAEDLLFSANALYNRGLYAHAATEYREFLERYADHEKAVAARSGLALSLYSAGKHEEAEPVFAKIVDDPGAEDRPKLRLLWGHTLLALRREAEAERAFRTAGPEKLARTGLLEAQFRLRKWKDVIETAQLMPDEPRALYQAAVAHFELHDTAAAIKLLENFDPQSPIATHAKLLLAECRLATGDADAAIRILGEDPSPRARVLLGRAFLHIKEYAQALACLKGMESEPEAAVLVARAYRGRGQPEEARRVLAAALDRGERADLRQEMAVVLADAGDFREAATHFERAGDPWRAAWALHRGGAYEESLKLLAKAPVTPDATLLRGENCFFLERYDEARAAYREVLDRAPDHAQASTVTFRLA